MKKILSIFLCAFLLLNVTGCFSSTNSNNGSEDSNGNEKISFGINETAIFEDVHYTVTNVEYSKGDEWDTPADGKQYVIVTLKIENKSNSKISYNEYDWKMLNSQGQEDDVAFVIFNSDTSLDYGDLAAGGTKTGTLIYEEPKDDSSLKLLYYSNSLFDENASLEFVIK